MTLVVPLRDTAFSDCFPCASGDVGAKGLLNQLHENRPLGMGFVNRKNFSTYLTQYIGIVVYKRKRYV